MTGRFVVLEGGDGSREVARSARGSSTRLRGARRRRRRDASSPVARRSASSSARLLLDGDDASTRAPRRC